MEGFLAAAQDTGRAGLEAQGGCVHGDIGARFVNDADDAHGHAAQADAQAVRPGALPEHLADGVGQGSDLATALCDAGDAVCGQGQAVDEAFVETVCPSGVDIDLVGGQDLVGVLDEGVGDGGEAGVFGARTQLGDSRLCGLGRLGDGHQITHGDQTFFLLNLRLNRVPTFLPSTMS